MEEEAKRGRLELGPTIQTWLRRPRPAEANMAVTLAEGAAEATPWVPLRNVIFGCDLLRNMSFAGYTARRIEMIVARGTGSEPGLC